PGQIRSRVPRPDGSNRAAPATDAAGLRPAGTAGTAGYPRGADRLGPGSRGGVRRPARVRTGHERDTARHEYSPDNAGTPRRANLAADPGLPMQARAGRAAHHG